MSTPDTPASPPTRGELAAQLTGELTQLRDALVLLSLSLKDWQFELDQNGSRTSQHKADQALEKFRLPRSAGLGKAEAAKSSTPEGS